MSVSRAQGFMGQPARSDDETNLRAAFMAAKAATVRVAVALSGWADPGPEALYPANTLRRLEMAARVHFGAACSLLFEDWLAYGADNHLRSLLEIFAHVAWIQGRGCEAPPMNARSRALCYELAMVNALIEEVKLLEEVDRRVRPDVSGPSAVLGIEAARADLVTLHPPDTCSCGGKGHGFWTVKRVLRDLAEAPEGVRLKGVDWMYPLWKYTSRIDHHAGFERMLRFDGDRRWIGPAEPWQRVQTFIWLLQVYGSIVGWIAEEFDRSVADELVKELAALSNHGALLSVARGNPKAFTLRDA